MLESEPGSTEPVIPFVHMNGTDFKTLYELRVNYGHAIRAATDALMEMAPNGRDYYLDPTGARWKLALAQHERRAAALRSLYVDIAAEIEALVELPR